MCSITKKRDLQSSPTSLLKMQVKWSPQHVAESHWLRNHSPSQAVKKSFSYLYCSQEFSGKPWVLGKWRENWPRKCKEGDDTAAPLFFHPGFILAQSDSGIYRALRASGQNRETCRASSAPSRVVCEPPHGWVSTRETDQPNRDGFHSWCQEFILLFNAGTNALFNKAIISMFGILWLSGTFRMPLS